MSANHHDAIRFAREAHQDIAHGPLPKRGADREGVQLGFQAEGAELLQDVLFGFLMARRARNTRADLRQRGGVTERRFAGKADPGGLPRRRMVCKPDKERASSEKRSEDQGPRSKVKKAEALTLSFEL